MYTDGSANRVKGTADAGYKCPDHLEDNVSVSRDSEIKIRD